MGEVELLPCPFCGGKAEWGYHDRADGEHHRCVDCGVEMHGGAENWNRRATRPAIDAHAIERIAAFLFNEMTGEPWTVAGVEAPNDDRDYYREIAQKVSALIEGETK